MPGLILTVTNRLRKFNPLAHGWGREGEVSRSIAPDAQGGGANQILDTLADTTSSNTV